MIYGINEQKVLYNHGGYYKESRWTPNNEQLVFISESSMAAGTAEDTGVFVSVQGKFPEFKQLLSYTYTDECSMNNCSFSLESVDNSKAIIRIHNYSY